jgi:hypothetical protein
MSSNEKTLLYLKEVEEAADLVLTTKQEIVDLDRKRNSNREALSAFEKQLKLVQSKFSNVIGVILLALINLEYLFKVENV